MRVVYLVLSVAIIGLGMFHIAAAPHFFPHLTAGALWFASGELAVAFTGGLYLFNCAYGETAFGVRVVCLIANVVTTCFALLVGYVSRASAAQFVLVIGVIAGAGVLSVLPSARRGEERDSIPQSHQLDSISFSRD